MQAMQTLQAMQTMQTMQTKVFEIQVDHADQMNLTNEEIVVYLTAMSWHSTAKSLMFLLSIFEMLTLIFT